MIDVIFMISFILTAAASLCSALLIAPLMAVLARRLGVVDRPDGHRKLHASAVPLTGGPTILLSVFAAMLVAKWSFPGLLGPDDGSLRFLLCLGGASCLIVFVGLLDDRFGLRGRQKLAGQFLAALVMVPSGIMIQRVELFGYPLEFGDVAPFITVFWMGSPAQLGLFLVCLLRPLPLSWVVIQTGSLFRWPWRDPCAVFWSITSPRLVCFWAIRGAC